MELESKVVDLHDRGEIHVFARDNAAPYSFPAEDSIEEGGPSLVLKYWHLVKRRRGVLILTSLLALVGSCLVTLRMPRVYRAQTSVEVQGWNDEFLNRKSVDPINPLPDFSGDAYIQTQIKVMQSDLLLQRTIKALKQIPGNEAFTTKRRWASNLFSREPISTMDRQELLAQAAASIQIRIAGETHIVEVLCDSLDPRLAAQFANSLVREFIEYNRESRWTSAQETGEWLTRELKNMKAKLETSERSLQDYASTAGLEFTDEKNSVAQARLRQLQEELSKVQADRVATQSTFDFITKQPASVFAVSPDSVATEYESKLSDLNRQRAELSTTMTAQNVKVRRLDAQIKETQESLDTERSKAIDKIDTAFNVARGREVLLNNLYNAQSRTVSNQSIVSIRYDMLKREVDSDRQLYDSMLQRVKEASLSSAMQASNLIVIDQAQPSTIPYKPSMLSNAGLGLVGGVVFGFLLVLFQDHIDQRFRNPGESMSYLNLPELGVIPSANAKSVTPYYQRPRNPLNITRTVGLVKGKDSNPQLIESFRAMLTSLLFISKTNRQGAVYVLTSAIFAEGKTTVASNLAIALTETRRKVILVDADMRRPRQHELFGLENRTGLSTLLEIQDPLNITDVNLEILKTEVSGLDLLPSGPANSNIGDLLYSARLPEVFSLLRAHYDTVIVDSPPMMHMADARILAKMSDGVVLVIRSSKTCRSSALIAKQRLEQDGTTIIGTVLNDWNPGGADVADSAYYRDLAKKAAKA